MFVPFYRLRLREPLLMPDTLRGYSSNARILVLDMHLEPMVVQHASSSVLSRSFYVRYSEEDFDVNDTVVFQLEKVSVCTGKRDVAAVR